MTINKPSMTGPAGSLTRAMGHGFHSYVENNQRVELNFSNPKLAIFLGLEHGTWVQFMYPLVICYIAMEPSTIFKFGKPSINISKRYFDFDPFPSSHFWPNLSGFLKLLLEDDKLGII